MDETNSIPKIKLKTCANAALEDHIKTMQRINKIISSNLISTINTSCSEAARTAILKTQSSSIQAISRSINLLTSSKFSVSDSFCDAISRINFRETGSESEVTLPAAVMECLAESDPGIEVPEKEQNTITIPVNSELFFKILPVLISLILFFVQTYLSSCDSEKLHLENQAILQELQIQSENLEAILEELQSGE